MPSKSKKEGEEISLKALQKNQKKAIPKAIKQLVWNFYIGEEIGKTECFCCGVTKITQLSFVCGHVEAEANGGQITIDNLRPVCAMCNSSMGTKNMIDFMKTHGLKGKAGPQTQSSSSLPPSQQVTKEKDQKIEEKEQKQEDESEASASDEGNESDDEHEETQKSPLDKKSLDEKVSKVRDYIIQNWENVFEKHKPPNLNKESYIRLKSYDFNLCNRLGVFSKRISF